MLTSDRKQRVIDAWAEAYGRLADVYDKMRVTLEMIRAYAPARAEAIVRAEAEAEAISARWLGGGKGGVQAAINGWVDAWLDGIDEVIRAQ